MHLNFWQPFPSFHQQGLLRALVRDPRVQSVRLYVEQDLPLARRHMSWPELEVSGLTVTRIEPGVIPEMSEDHVHVFTGFGTHPGVWGAFARLPPGAACHCYAYAEAPDTTGVAGWIRQWKYRAACTHGMYGLKTGRRPLRVLKGVFAVGDRGVHFYREVCQGGCPVIPFGYYDVEESELKNVTEWRGVDSVNLLVVGQLIRCKGVDLLLRALGGLKDQNWHLRIAGAGPEEKKLRDLSVKLGISGRIDWLGVLGREAVHAEYRNARCLLVSSRAEGWGMNINEALREGCPVRASVMAGAASLLPEAWRVRPEVGSLRSQIKRMLTEGDAGQESLEAQKLMYQTTGEAGTERLLQVIET